MGKVEAGGVMKVREVSGLSPHDMTHVFITGGKRRFTKVTFTTGYASLF